MECHSSNYGNIQSMFAFVISSSTCWRLPGLCERILSQGETQGTGTGEFLAEPRPHSSTSSFQVSSWLGCSICGPTQGCTSFFFSPHCSWLTVFCQFFYCTSSVREGEKSFMPCQSQYLIYLSDFLLFLDCLSQAWEINVNNTDLLYGCWGCLLLGSDCLPGRGGREVNLKRS